ncbi:MAG: precorrin-6A/cobalt-precorrin-6A reductase, partial [Alphaproteobacteria bacterium]|nr:precorrin-6A/cobalt-precorrin-6A reductase [Alphaproteobacteria bacterium]
RGPFDVAAEIALLRDRNIDVIVTKNSGGDATAAKLAAARALRLPVVMVARPAEPPAETVPDVAAALAWLARHVGAATLRGA